MFLENGLAAILIKLDCSEKREQPVIQSVFPYVHLKKQFSTSLIYFLTAIYIA